MLSIRTNTFETNSSSVHALVVIDDEQLKLFESGEYCLYCRDKRVDDEIYGLYEQFNPDHEYDIEETYNDVMRYISDGGRAVYTVEDGETLDDFRETDALLIPRDREEEFYPEWVANELSWSAPEDHDSVLGEHAIFTSTLDCFYQHEVERGNGWSVIRFQYRS